MQLTINQWVLITLLATAVLIYVYQKNFAELDPRKNRQPWLFRYLEDWEDWNSLSWEEKMAIFRRRQKVHWVFVIVAMLLILTMTYLSWLQIHS